jgi:hypothetical protein
MVSFESPTNGATPLSIEFVVWGTTCGATSAVVMNTRRQTMLSSYPIADSCDCSLCQFKIATGNVLDFNPSGPNTITMDVGVLGGEAVAYVEVCIEYCR